jgi:hypothetical protein
VANATDQRLRARALTDQAVQAALEGDWPRATEINKAILESSPDDIEARSRYGRALLELGRVDEARAAYGEVLKVEPHNLIANRTLQRLTTLGEVNKKPIQTKTKTQPRLFIEDMGKTGIVRLINTAPPPVMARYGPGSEVRLQQQGELVAVHATDRELLGFLEPKVGRRLLSFLAAGNEYVAALVSSDPQNARIAIRETYQHPSMAGKVPFPGSHRPAETRAYIRGTFFRFGAGEEEDELLEEAEEETGAVAEGEEELEKSEVLDEVGIAPEDVEEAEGEETEE